MEMRYCSNISLVYQCTGCEMMTLQPLGMTIQRSNNNNKFLLPTGPPVNEHCVHCSHKHKVSAESAMYLQFGYNQ